MENYFNQIKRLDKFYDYCENLIAENKMDDEDDLFDLWMMAVLIDKPSLEEYIKDVEKTIDRYNHWLSEAVTNQLFLIADTIKKALDIEITFAKQVIIKHFNKKNSSVVNDLLKESNHKYNLTND